MFIRPLVLPYSLGRLMLGRFCRVISLYLDNAIFG